MPQKRFIFYKQSFIGLKSKKYRDDSIYINLPSQLGKRIISKHKKGSTFKEILIEIVNNHSLSEKETEFILKNLKYYNENKRD